MAEAIPARDSLYLQLAALAGNEPASSYFEIRCLRPDGGPGPRHFIPVGELWRTVEVVVELRDHNVYVGAAPRVRESGKAQDVERCWAVWVDCDTPEAVEALRRFRPLPSVVVRTSPGRVQAFWALRRPISPAWARRANRRIAHALDADLAATDVARIVRAIGSVNWKYTPPVSVTAARVEVDVFELAEIVGNLPDAPGEIPRPRSGNAEPATGSLAALVRAVREAQVGQRNAILYWAACRAREEGLIAREELREAALETGLPEAEVERTLDSAERQTCQ